MPWFQLCLAQFRLGRTVRFCRFLHLLGIMASMRVVIPLGPLLMRSVQCWILVTCFDASHHLNWPNQWRDPQPLSQGVLMGVVPQGGHDRRVPPRVGCAVQGLLNLENMDGVTECTADQLPGTSDSLFSAKAPPPTLVRPTCAGQIRQHDDSGIHQQTGVD